MAGGRGLTVFLEKIKMLKQFPLVLTSKSGMWSRIVLMCKPTFVSRIFIVFFLSALSFLSSPSALQIYTDWANHYLAKSGHKRLIKDLQQDIADGVLLAEIIQIIGKTYA